MYQNKFVAAIKVGGKILRETNNGSVSVPFGSEYAVYLKNLNTVRAKVHVTIDGAEAMRDLVLNPHQQVDLERFFKGDMNSGRRFRFIERTAQIEAHRGIGGEDGLVHIEFAFENPPAITNRSWTYTAGSYGGQHTNSGVRASSRLTRSGVTGQSVGGFDSETVSETSVYTSSAMPMAAPQAIPAVSDVGITVQGSESNQRFVSVQDFAVGASEVIVLHLRGLVGNQPVMQPITVKTKITCPTCGYLSKSGLEYCARCSTALVGV